MYKKQRFQNLLIYDLDKLEFLLYNKHTIKIAILLFGLVERPWSTEWRGISPLFLLFGATVVNKTGVPYLFSKTDRMEIEN